MHTLSIPYPTRATLTYTAPVWDCALNLIVLQPPLPTRRSIPVLPWDPAPLWPHRELFHHNTTLANSVFPLLIRERPPSPFRGALQAGGSTGISLSMDFWESRAQPRRGRGSSRTPEHGLVPRSPDVTIKKG